MHTETVTKADRQIALRVGVNGTERSGKLSTEFVVKHVGNLYEVSTKKSCRDESGTPTRCSTQ